ncbi:hypothetical protein M8J76_014996 [Diaphorina citri]|nr:hypothetical protein M8J76_014996 [Diaphorina citri]
MKKAKFRRMSIISNSFDVRTSQRVKNKNHLDEDRKKDKQLLTPNIKRFLKTWLLDHKDYPYPDRYEKIMLAQETGLTIMQICNWFANWRRKLKLYSKDFKRRSYKASEDKTDEDDLGEDSDDTTHHRSPYSWQSSSPSRHQNTTTQYQPERVYPNHAIDSNYLMDPNHPGNSKHLMDKHSVESQYKGDADWTNNARPEIPQATSRSEAPSEVKHKPATKTPKLWRPQEDLGIENKDLMLLKWLKSISTFDSIKYHPCYTKYVWDSDRVKQMLDGDAPEIPYRFDRLGPVSPGDKYLERIGSVTPGDKYFDRLNASPGSTLDSVGSVSPGDHQYERLSSPGDRFEARASPNAQRGYCDVHLDEVRQSDEILAAEILASFAQNRQGAGC